jgi:hypothetical protein
MSTRFSGPPAPGHQGPHRRIFFFFFFFTGKRNQEQGHRLKTGKPHPEDRGRSKLRKPKKGQKTEKTKNEGRRKPKKDNKETKIPGQREQGKTRKLREQRQGT